MIARIVSITLALVAALFTVHSMAGNTSHTVSVKNDTKDALSVLWLASNCMPPKNIIKKDTAIFSDYDLKVCSIQDVQSHTTSQYAFLAPVASKYVAIDAHRRHKKYHCPHTWKFTSDRRCVRHISALSLKSKIVIPKFHSWKKVYL